MAPTPNRGKRNQSNYISFIIDEIATITGRNRKEIEEITIFNTKSLFNLK